VRRILILSASGGAGHLRAAEAVQLAIQAEDATARVQNIDVLTLARRAFRDAYSKWYLSLVNRAPALWGYLYDRLDHPPRRHPLDLRRVLDRWNTRELRARVEAFSPDAIVCTHFLPAEVLAESRARGRLTIPLGVVITDADVHRLWIHQGVTRYFVAREEACALLSALGFAGDQVELTGIPVDPRFGVQPDKAALRLKHDLPKDGAVVLLLGGGFGVGPLQDMAARIEAARRPSAIVVVAGRNIALQRALEKAKGPRTRVLGFTKAMDEWMGAADLLITKPGGLTTAEALARGLPMILVNPIPGQEQRNADALLEAGAALKANNPEVLAWKVDHLLSNPDRMAALQEAAGRMARPQAATLVARWALGVR